MTHSGEEASRDICACQVYSPSEQITVLPFTRNPLKLLQHARSRKSSTLREPGGFTSISDFSGSEGLDAVAHTILPKTIKTPFFAIYPIYQPVWLAECNVTEDGKPTRKVTVALYGSAKSWQTILTS